MEENFERIDPNYKIIQGTKILRGPKGDVSIDTPNNVIIKASPEDTVDIVCLTSDTGQIYFWSIPSENKTSLHALRSSKSCSLPADVTFEDMYKSSKPHFAAGYFVKYKTSGACGILYISKLEIRSVISHTHKYSDISFENDMFYASRNVTNSADTSDCSKAESKHEYFILDVHGKVIKKTDFPVKKVPRFEIYYDSKFIFFNNATANLTGCGTILSVSVVKPNEHQFPEWILIRIKTEDETYYYTKELKPLARLLSDDILLAEPDGLFLLETQESRITRAFHIGVDGSSGGLVKELLTVPVIEKVYVRESSANANECIQVIPNLGKTFFATENALYSFSSKESKFITIFNNVSNVANYKFVDAINEQYPSDKKMETLYGIIGFSEKNMPVCFAAYDDENTIRYSEIFDVIEPGFTLNSGITQYICHGKSTNQIVVTDEKSIIFCTGGKTANCKPRNLITRCSRDKGIPIYLVEFDKGNIIMNINTAGQILI